MRALLKIEGSSKVLPKGAIEFNTGFQFEMGGIGDLAKVAVKPNTLTLTGGQQCHVLLVNVDHPKRPDSSDEAVSPLRY